MIDGGKTLTLNALGQVGDLIMIIMLLVCIYAIALFVELIVVFL